MDQKFNIITFTVTGGHVDDNGGPTLTLKLDGEWVISCGLEPNINRAIVPFTEFDKLPAGPSGGGPNPDQIGTINFYYSADPAKGGKPDYSIQNVRIVDVAANLVAECKATPAGKSTLRIAEYVLFFADFREKIVPPRGGRLLDGPLNIGSDDINYPTPLASPHDNQDLAHRCLKAMGLDNEVPDAVKSFHPLMNLQWHGAHAPTELAKILEHCNAVFAPQSSGEGLVFTTGSGDLPSVSQDRKEYQLTLPGIDRRGKTVIFSSAPTAVCDTYQLSGVDHTTGGSNPLIYMCKSAGPSGAWGPMGPSQASNIQNHSPYPPDAYRALQINPDTFDPRLRPVLRRVFSSDSVPNRSALTVSATIATQDLGGAWNNSTDTNIDVTHVYEGNIIVLAQRLGKVSTPDTGNVDGQFEEIDSGPLVTVTVESTAPCPSNNVLLVREFFYSGWRRDAGTGTPTQLSDDEVNNALADPGQDVVIIHRPEMRLVRNQTGASDITQKYSSGETDNKADLTTRCQQLADRYLRGSGSPAVEIAAKGFLSAEVNGKVAEIRIDQDRCRTVFKVQTWWIPSGQTGKLAHGEGGFAGGGGGGGSGGAAATGGKAGGSPGVPGGGSPSGGSTHSLGSGTYPGQDQTHHESLATGATQARQPLVTTTHPPQPTLQLPPGGNQYQVLQRPDDMGFISLWGWVRAHA